MRKTYIENNDPSLYDEYLKSFKDKLTETEIVKTEDSLGRVTAKTVFAKVCDPCFNAAAMDGIAVLSQKCSSASEKTPVRLVEGKDFVYVNTGNKIYHPYDAVIMIEDVAVIDEQTVEIREAVHPWQHVRVKGEGIVAQEMVLPLKRKIRPVDVGAIYASGNTEVTVYKKPCVGIITTGEEMVDSPDMLTDGKLLESNSRLFGALISSYGGRYKRYPTVKDDPSSLGDALDRALTENDIVIINAGSSAGTKDFACSVIGEKGEIFLHGLAIKPGKPTILATCKGKPVLGVPGYPVSAYLVVELFLKPLIYSFVGLSCANDETTVNATVTKNIVSSLKNTEYIRMSMGKVGGKLVATPLERGAAQIMSLVKADGILKIDRFSEGITAGNEAEITLCRPIDTIEKNLVVTGSHDLIIDVIGETVPLTAAHVGSMGGIFALSKKECHIAPIHLLDLNTGIYNISYVKKYFEGEKMLLIKGVGRTQGLIVQKGNPKNINSIQQIVNENIPFANRQKGAGTRLLFDYMLSQIGADSSMVNGYEKEYATHLAVGMAVEAGAADAGMGVKSAANCLGLDFIPLRDEEYDFLIRKEDFSDQRIKAFFEYIKSEEFKERIKAFGDYTVKNIGEVIEI